MSITRRNFLSTTSAGLGTILMFGATKAQAQDGLKTLRIATSVVDGVKGTMDPAFGKNDPDSARIVLVFERLVDIDESFSPIPQLATEWSSNADGSVWTFKLREGVKFHDGSDFTAADVVYSFKRLLDPAVASPAAATIAQIDPAKIVAIDPLTVEFGLTTPIVEFPLLIANRFTYIVKDGQTSDQLRTTGIGTGAFKVESYVPGQEPAIFAKHDQYWRPGLPHVDKVEMRSIPDESARISALTADQVDIIWDMPLRALGKLESNPGVKVVTTPTPYWFGIALWTDTAPFNDVRVRQAIKHAVNRDQMLKAVLGGHGTVAGDQPVAPWMQFAIQDEAPKQDIDLAKRLLAEAGHPDGFEMELYTSDVQSGFEDIAVIFQAQVAKAGIRVNIVKAPASEYWSTIWLKKPAMVTSWAGRATDEALTIAFLSDAEWNDTHWKNADFDAAILEARKTLDVTARGELYQKAQRILAEDGGALVLMFGDAAAATRADISGWKLHPQLVNQSFVEAQIDG